MSLFQERLLEAKREGNGELLFPEFQDEIVVWAGYPFWKKDSRFNLQNHILKGEEFFDTRPRQSTAHLTPEEKYEKIEKEILMEPFKVGGGSPWKCYLFHEDSRTILICSVHHVMGDGLSIYSALLRLADPSSSAEDSKALFSRPRMPTFQIFKKILFQFPSLILPVNLVGNSMKCLPLPPPLQPQPNRGEQMSFERHFVKSSKISKQTIKLIAQRHGVPFTVILFAGLTGALRKYFQKLNVQIPEFVNCSVPLAPPATIPVPSDRPGQRLSNNM
jgi:hypothetical protein